MMQLVLSNQGPQLQRINTLPVKAREDVVPARMRLTQGKKAIWKEDVEQAMLRPVGMFTLIESRRP